MKTSPDAQVELQQFPLGRLAKTVGWGALALLGAAGASWLLAGSEPSFALGLVLGGGLTLSNLLVLGYCVALLLGGSSLRWLSPILMVLKFSAVGGVLLLSLRSWGLSALGLALGAGVAVPVVLVFGLRSRFRDPPGLRGQQPLEPGAQQEGQGDGS